jgi:hypothetical protein
MSCPPRETAQNAFDVINTKILTKNKILEDSFQQTHTDLKRQKFDITYSGTTA